MKRHTVTLFKVESPKEADYETYRSLSGDVEGRYPKAMFKGNPPDHFDIAVRGEKQPAERSWWLGRN